MSFKAVLNDPNVEAVLVNIFAGINRCDWIAEGVVRAVRELELEMPLVVRLSGTNDVEGRKILDESGLNITVTETLAEAAVEVVTAWKAVRSKNEGAV